MLTRTTTYCDWECARICMHSDQLLYEQGGSPTNHPGSRQRQDTGPGDPFKNKKNGPYTESVLLRRWTWHVTLSITLIYIDPNYDSPLIYWWGYCNLSILIGYDLNWSSLGNDTGSPALLLLEFFHDSKDLWFLTHDSVQNPGNMGPTKDWPRHESWCDQS